MNGSRRQQGFTLIEIMVVIAIIATLMSLVIVGIPYVMRKSKEGDTKARVNEISASIHLVRSADNLAELPPTHTSRLMLGNQKIGLEVGEPNKVNVGIETLAVVLFMNEMNVERLPVEYLINRDEDTAKKNIVIHQVNDLFELKDAFDQPLVYFHASDYKTAYDAKEHLVSINQEGEPPDDILVQPWLDGTTRGFKNPGSFQLFSLGNDGEPNTPDDIGNFETD